MVQQAGAAKLCDVEKLVQMGVASSLQSLLYHRVQLAGICQCKVCFVHSLSFYIGPTQYLSGISGAST